ncbi:hypothetical protein JCGZ_18282 [Jatropha curcas]|uniref:NmrA-like domain-containing protein n=1 Tax=Jatropha curcas TaxID=180498 RepID=A0A067JZG2_JATCU|nr:leucoanthocyanidin reductase [Jatropha curcas]KDP29361.1 hypothetical protein JCGZ_18282 [Jatropha curcas]
MTISTPFPNTSVLIAGGTGFIGQFVVTASLDSGRQTYVLIRPTPTTSPSREKLIKSFQEKGAIILHGSINEKENMKKLLKEHKIDVVISAIGGECILDQLALVEAINAVGTVKRYLPSEFGHDVDRADPVEPGLTMYIEKRKVRRLIEECGIPYTYICCNSIASWPYYTNRHPADAIPPLDEFQIYGDGNTKAYFVAGSDIGKFTVKAADDVRTINKLVHFRPSCNFYNMNELAALWEKKIGKTLPRATITENDLLAVAAENQIPESIVASFTHDIFIRGCQINFSIDGPNDVELSSLYPDEPYRTLDECFGEFLLRLDGKKDETVAPNANEKPVNKKARDETAMVEPLIVTATCA